MCTISMMLQYSYATGSCSLSFQVEIFENKTNVKGDHVLKTISNILVTGFHYSDVIMGLFRCRSKKTLKVRVTGLCAGNSPVTGEFPLQMVSNAEMFPFDDVIMVGRKNVL